MLKDSKDNLKVLHPLPRVKEINQDVDDNPKAYYFEQAKNGMYTRQAIICESYGYRTEYYEKRITSSSTRKWHRNRSY